jgi:hypothetical protein
MFESLRLRSFPFGNSQIRTRDAYGMGIEAKAEDLVGTTQTMGLWGMLGERMPETSLVVSLRYVLSTVNPHEIS